MKFCHNCGKEITSKYGTKFCSRACNIPSLKSRKPKMSKNVFCEKANNIHSSKYDYSKVIMPISIRDKIEIICPIHGKFYQTKGDHLAGCGCQKCSHEKTSQNHKKIKNKEYILPSGKTVILQGYEPKAVDILLSKGYNESDLILDDLRPRIKFLWSSSDGYGDNKYHFYHPDILIKSENKIIEVKSSWTYDGNGKDAKKLAKNLAKQQASIAQGYSFEFYIL